MNFVEFLLVLTAMSAFGVRLYLAEDINALYDRTSQDRPGVRWD